MTRTAADFNKGNIYQSRSGGILSTAINRTQSARLTAGRSVMVNSPYNTPISAANGFARISRYFTVAEFTGCQVVDPIPHNLYDTVMTNHKNLAYSVLDKIRHHWDIEIISAYRTEGSNHSTGRAVDIAVGSGNPHVHAEIAHFAKDFLPVDQVWLERNASGMTHVHLRGSLVGVVDTPQVLTFTNAEGTTSADGIVIELLLKDIVR